MVADQDLFPGRIETRDAIEKDNRQFVNGVLWIVRSGSPWTNLPERYADWKNTHRRFNCWAEVGEGFDLLAKDAKWTSYGLSGRRKSRLREKSLNEELLVSLTEARHKI